MPDIFTPVIQKLHDLGFFKFVMPYMLTSAIFYGLLRKSKVFGEPEKNVGVNATVALVASLMAWAAPIIAGIDIETQLAAFFMQSTVISLVFIVAIMISGMFLPPDLPKTLADALKNKVVALIIIGIGAGIFVLLMSGLFSATFGGVLANVSSDILWTIVALVLLILPLIFIMSGKEEKK